MKSINVTFSNEQSDALEYISSLCRKETPEFIREALVCLLPLNEYIEVKTNLIQTQKNPDQYFDTESLDRVSDHIKNIDESTTNRLKRIGML